MLGHEEANEIADPFLSTHPLEDRLDDADPDRHVPSLPVLPDVVEQRSEEEGSLIRELLHGLGPDGVVVGVLAREDPGHRTKRAGEMRVHREPVVGVALRTAPHIGPLRYDPASTPSRSRISSDVAPRSPVRSRRENARRVSSSQTTSPEMPASSIESRSAAEGSRPASASADRASNTPTGLPGRRTEGLPPRGSAGSPLGGLTPPGARARTARA